MASPSVSSIKTAFAGGSGLQPGQMITVAVVAVVLLLLIFGMSVLFKKLSMFQKDNDANDLIKVTLILFLVFIIGIIFIQAVSIY